MNDAVFRLKNFQGFSESKTSCLLPPFYSEMANRILNTPIYKDDVWVISYPRTGSTWVQEIVWLIGNNLNFNQAETILQQERAPVVESTAFLITYSGENVIMPEKPCLPLPLFKKTDIPFEEIIKTDGDAVERLFSNSIDYVENIPSPRFIKSHLPIGLLPNELFKIKPKIIYIMRNPKDVCVSYYHYCKLVHKLNLDFNHFCELFMNDSVPLGSIFNHYLGFWKMREEENILILTYEDLKKSPEDIVKKIGIFMEKMLSDDDIYAICKFLTFENMQKNKSCNLQVFVDAMEEKDYYRKTGTHFIRKGIIGDHKNIMTAEVIRKFDEWIKINTRGTNINFEN
ncbi:hypothetical protein GWI33_020977 [Rhynchophorus ferrugineus]|uniref:Sulfotransferase domain-containing protein n=1 Tax=Rhynchophorus ferrugineus TaxID=354439 RepID=A0A834HR14_RHYFE|nr:hypothetical protein GWI33_020977 [Rhynchophorus ferrugineus]